MSSLEETIGQNIKDKEDIKRQLTQEENVTTFFLIFNDQVHPVHTTTTASTRNIGSSFVVGHPNNGVIGSNGTWISTQGINLDGNNDLVTVPNTTSALKREIFTLEGWFKPDNVTGTFQYIAQMGSLAATAGDGFLLRMNDANPAKLQIALISGATTQLITGSTSLTLSAWHHFAYVVSGFEMQLFLNGNSDAVLTSTIKPYYYTNNALRMGEGVGGGPSLHFDGVVDEWRYSSNRRYTSNFTPGSRFDVDANTVALWHMDEGTGTTTDNAEGTAGLDGSLDNGANWTTGVSKQLVLNPQPYIGDSRGAPVSVVSQTRDNPFLDQGKNQIRDFLMGSSAASAPSRLLVGSGNFTWNGSLTALQYQISSEPFDNKGGSSSKLGSYVIDIPSTALSGQNITELGISGNGLYIYDTFSSINKTIASEVQFIVNFRVGS